MDIELTVTLLIVALCINGAGIGGQQVVGVVDASVCSCVVLVSFVGVGYGVEIDVVLVAVFVDRFSNQERFVPSWSVTLCA